MSKGTILVIDDEKDLIELVRYNLEREGFDVLAATDGRTGLELAERRRPDVIVLDLMMPGVDGLEVCRQLRKNDRTSDVLVLMLTAKAGESDRVVGLELGADDYVTKPFSPRELVARVKALVRRASRGEESRNVIQRGDLVVDVAAHEVTFKGTRVLLTATEFRILHAMAARPNRVFSRNDLVDAALGHDISVSDRTIDVHMTAIRKKLGAGGEYIETVRGVGYKIREPATEPA
jgi:two-component system, OmpR family, alkaline phosphatase synthesis response regulator PhoP